MCTVVCGLLLASCGDAPVEVDAPAPSGAALDSCRSLVDALPDQLGDASRREVSVDGYAAAWGDPPLVLTCGTGEPDGFDRFSECLEVGGVGWYVPPEQEEDPDVDVVLTAVGFAPRVSLRVPAEQRGSTSAAALTALAVPMAEHLDEVDACA